MGMDRGSIQIYRLSFAHEKQAITVSMFAPLLADLHSTTLDFFKITLTPLTHTHTH